MSDTLWSARFTGPAMIERNKSQEVAVTIERSGSAASVSSATFTVYDPQGAKIKDAVACTISGGAATGTIAAGDTDGKSLERNWLVQFDVTIGGKVYQFYNDAVLCAARLYSPIGQTDLIQRHSDVVSLVSAAKANLQDYIDTAWTDNSTLFDAGDRYSELSDRYAETYSKEYDGLRSKIDIGEDNTIDGGSVPVTASIHLSSGPRRRWL